MVTTVTLIFVFLVGVLVGRGVDGRPGDEPIASAEAAPAPATGAADAGAAPAEPPSPPVEDELSYHKRLQSNAPADEVQPEAQAEPPPVAPAAPPPPQAPAPAGADVPTTGRSGTWVLQIIALKSRPNAAELVKRLAGKGYPAFLQNPAPGEPVIYRVRVGRFNDRREAEQVR